MSDVPPKTLSSRFQTLSQLQPVEPSPGKRIYERIYYQEKAAGTRDAGWQKDRFSLPDRAEQAVQNRSIGTLAERAQARYRLGHMQCTNSPHGEDLFGEFIGDRNGRHTMQIALFQPDIPQNTGTILRLCACLDVTAHIIEPAGFPVSDRHFRRAGMDYLDHVSIMRHDSWSEFEQWRSRAGNRLILFTTRSATSYLDYRYGSADILLFGRESAGVPEEVARVADARLVIPIMPNLRSMNVAMAAAMALGEALRQIGPAVEEATR